MLYKFRFLARWISIPLALSAHLVASAQTELAPIMGLPFGKAMDRAIVSCPGYSTPIKDDYCATGRGLALGEIRPSVAVNPPTEPKGFAVPGWLLRTEPIYLTLSLTGALVRMQLATVGPGSQARVIAAVVDRFGTPTAQLERTAQNAYGASWPVTSARWVTPLVIISHDCFRRDSCQLIFTTPEAEAAEQQRTEERRSKDKL